MKKTIYGIAAIAMFLTISLGPFCTPEDTFPRDVATAVRNADRVEVLARARNPHTIMTLSNDFHGRERVGNLIDLFETQRTRDDFSPENGVSFIFVFYDGDTKCAAMTLSTSDYLVLLGRGTFQGRYITPESRKRLLDWLHKHRWPLRHYYYDSIHASADL